MLAPLLDQVDEPIASVTADGAYDTVTCYDAILNRQAKPIIPPRSNAVLWQENAIGIARNHTVQGCRHLGWQQWKRKAGYHQWSRVESKMFAFKRLGHGVSSRCFNRQVVDLYIRVNIMNRFTQLGIKLWLLHKLTKLSSQSQLKFYLCNKDDNRSIYLKMATERKVRMGNWKISEKGCCS